MTAIVSAEHAWACEGREAPGLTLVAVPVTQAPVGEGRDSLELREHGAVPPGLAASHPGPGAGVQASAPGVQHGLAALLCWSSKLHAAWPCRTHGLCFHYSFQMSTWKKASRPGLGPHMCQGAVRVLACSPRAATHECTTLPDCLNSPVLLFPGLVSLKSLLPQVIP